MTLLFVAFICFKLALWGADAAFISPDSFRGWHFLDKSWLVEDLANSMLYLHSQPPLFNLYLGLMYKLFPEHAHLGFELTFNLFSFIIYACMYLTLRKLGAPLSLAFAAATAYLIGPESIVFGNWVYYTWPVACLTTVAVYAFVSFEQSRNLKYAALCLASVTFLCLTRSLFHLGFLFVVLGLLLCICNIDRKKVAAFGAVAVFSVGLVYMKNYVLFDNFGASSWMGMHLWRIVSLNKELADEVAVEKGLPAGGSFKPVSSYSPELVQLPERYRNIPQLAYPKKIKGGLNYNHYGYINVSSIYLDACLETIKRDIPAYLRAVKLAWVYYSIPSWKVEALKQPDLIQQYLHWVTLTDVRKKIEGKILGEHTLSAFTPFLLTPVLLCIVLTYGLYRIFRRRGALDISTAFILATIFYVAVLGNSMEVYENSRFRTLTTPLVYIMVALFLLDSCRSVSARIKSRAD